MPENSSAAVDKGVNGCVPGGLEEEVGLKSGEIDRSAAGGRWPREEALALLKIRSEMDGLFREKSSIKAPLWEEVSRKLSELGYNRSASKCKEKFENISKYHRRAREGRSSNPKRKTYRFSEQLEALDSHSVLPPVSPENSRTSMGPISLINPSNSSAQVPETNLLDKSASTHSSSGKESEGTRKKKRKYADIFERLMKDVIEKQEDLQRKFIEAIEKYEQDRIAREEVWKKQEVERIKRERELLAQQRSIAAAKDAAVLAFLEKFSEKAQMNEGQVSSETLNDNPCSAEKFTDKPDNSCSNSKNFTLTSSSRWPKEEIDSLIRIRSNLETRDEEIGHKGLLWEDISAAMKELGYDRSAKRCKEKWENINKYFRKVRERRKRKPEDTKTCPYFQQLDALYKERTNKVNNSLVHSSGYELNPEQLLMHMAGGYEDRQERESVTGNCASENVNQNHEKEEEEDNEDERNASETAVNNSSSMAVVQ